MYKKAALVYGNDLHFLDHIAPLASFLEIPLFVTEDKMAERAKMFYPGTVSKVVSPLTFAETILTNYEVLFTCLPKQLIDPLFFFDEHKLRKKLLTIWLPHGNSDKENLSALTKESLLLVYGKQMVDRLGRDGIAAAKCVPIGNLRAHFYKTHKQFYDKLLTAPLSFSKKQTTLFYGPTWNDIPLSKLLSTLPDHYNLYVKIHPNRAEEHVEKYRDYPNIKFLDEIPTIYPILDRTDVYIGDHSSIAYDYLLYDRPLFFLTNRRTLIHHTGEIVDIETLFTKIESEDRHHEARSEIYRYCFDSRGDFQTLSNQIDDAIKSYFESGVHFL